MWTVFILFGGIFCVCADSCGIFLNLKLKKKLLCYIRSWSECCGIFLWRAFLNDLSLWNTATATTTTSVNFVYGLFWDFFRLVIFCCFGESIQTTNFYDISWYMCYNFINYMDNLCSRCNIAHSQGQWGSIFSKWFWHIVSHLWWLW